MGCGPAVAESCIARCMLRAMAATTIATFNASDARGQLAMREPAGGTVGELAGRASSTPAVLRSSSPSAGCVSGVSFAASSSFAA
eukprot:6144418-Pleurochrysis_carterae.AAC.1